LELGAAPGDVGEEPASGMADDLLRQPLRIDSTDAPELHPLFYRQGDPNPDGVESGTRSRCSLNIENPVIG
jgi:hypothetical protein